MLKRKSNFDVDNAIYVISSIEFGAILLAVLVLVVAIIFGLSVFGDNGVNNTTNEMRDNVISMVSNFFAMVPTIGTILAVVILISVILLLVMYVMRLRNTNTAGASGQFAG
jgi:uncharacterized membrane protein